MQEWIVACGQGRNGVLASGAGTQLLQLLILLMLVVLLGCPAGYFKDNIVTHLVAGLGAGFFAVCVGSPVDVVKSRVMGEPCNSDLQQHHGWLLCSKRHSRCSRSVQQHCRSASQSRLQAALACRLLALLTAAGMQQLLVC